MINIARINLFAFLGNFSQVLLKPNKETGAKEWPTFILDETILETPDFVRTQIAKEIKSLLGFSIVHPKSIFCFDEHTYENPEKETTLHDLFYMVIIEPGKTIHEKVYLWNPEWESINPLKHYMESYVETKMPVNKIPITATRLLSVMFDIYSCINAGSLMRRNPFGLNLTGVVVHDK